MDLRTLGDEKLVQSRQRVEMNKLLIGHVVIFRLRFTKMDDPTSTERKIQVQTIIVQTRTLVGVILINMPSLDVHYT